MLSILIKMEFWHHEIFWKQCQNTMAITQKGTIFIKQWPCMTQTKVET